VGCRGLKLKRPAVSVVDMLLCWVVFSINVGTHCYAEARGSMGALAGWAGLLINVHDCCPCAGGAERGGGCAAGEGEGQGGS
jgi:hypothetical protein